MKKIILTLWCLLTINSIFAADTCQWNICIDSNGNIYIKNSDSIYNSLLSWTNLSGTTSGTGTTLSGSVSTWSVNTGTTNNTEISFSSVFLPRAGTTKTTTQELEESILWWHTNWLTIYDTITDYKADQLLLREQAAKIFYNSALILEFNSAAYKDCSFSDIDTVTDDLKKSIANICAMWWLMKWNEWEFSPFRQLSYAETITIIARLTWIKNTTSTSAWRTPYLNHVKKLWILKWMNMDESNMEKKITRWETITLLYRLAQVAQANWGDFSNIDSATTTIDNSNSSSVSIGAGIIDAPKFTTALLWMYHNEMTIYWRASDFDPFNILTREQAAKILSIYDSKFTKTTRKWTCSFSDTANSSLQAYITDLCQKWLFNNNKLFRPTQSITKSEFVEALLLLIDPTISSGATSQQIISKAIEHELITQTDTKTFDKPITRYEVALMLSDYHFRSAFIENLKDNTNSYNVISPASNDNTTYPAGQQKVFIDINSIDAKEFNNGYITIFGKSYKITKKEILHYFPTSYTWFGEISDVNNDTVIGNISMAIGQNWGTKVLVEGFISFPDTQQIYTIYPTNQIPYYIITRIK